MTRFEVRRLTGPEEASPRIEDLALTVQDGAIAALLGGADSGARGLLRLLAGLDRAADGEVLLDGRPVQAFGPHQRGIGVVFRDTPLWEGTVYENVVFGLARARWAPDDRERRVAAVLELVGMTGSEAEHVGELPEGERRRVALARALAPDPAALLLEAPGAAVEEPAKPAYAAALRQVLRSTGLTTLVATDDLREAVALADDLHVLAGGRILQSGEVARVLAGPASVEVAEAVGYATLVRGQVQGQRVVEPGVGAVEFPEGFPLAGAALVLAHPATMLGVPEASGLGCGVAGVVERVRPVGPTYVLDLRVAERLVEVRWEWDAAAPPPGAPLAITVTPAALRYFREARVEEDRVLVEPAPDQRLDTSAIATPPPRQASSHGAPTDDDAPPAEPAASMPAPLDAPPARAWRTDEPQAERGEAADDAPETLAPWTQASMPLAPASAAEEPQPGPGRPPDASPDDPGG